MLKLIEALVSLVQSKNSEITLLKNAMAWCLAQEHNAPINVKPAGGRRGIGREFDIFQQIAVKFPTPGQKCEVKYN